MREMFVRTSSHDDQDIIEQHIRASRLEAEEYRGSLPDGISSSVSLSFVGVVGLTVFGSIGAFIDDQDQWAVSHVYVQPEARGIGLGDALITALLSELRTQNAEWLSATTLPGDRAMKNLFERHGLIAQSIRVGRRLSDPSN